MIFPGMAAADKIGESVYMDVGFGGSAETFVVPAGVRRISVVAIGHGADGDSTGGIYGYDGGAGGDLAYSNHIVVTPGETLTITSATNGVTGTNGVGLFRGATKLVFAVGGGVAGLSTGDVKHSGGARGSGNYSGNGSGGGGGAAGYTSKGGKGGNVGTAGASSVDGGGGGGGSPTDLGGSYSAIPGIGGGTYLGGINLAGGPGGAGGAAQVGQTQPPGADNGGNGGLSGTHYGGTTRFGAGGRGDSIWSHSVAGGPNGLRIIWGAGKSYPYNARV